MWLDNQKKEYDKSLYPVRQLFAFCRFCGIDEKYAKAVYDYVMHNEPYGCYISGAPKDKMIDDYFVLSPLFELENGLDQQDYWEVLKT